MTGRPRLDTGGLPTIKLVCSDKGHHPQRVIQTLVDRRTREPDPGEIETINGLVPDTWSFKCRKCGRHVVLNPKNFTTIVGRLYEVFPGPVRTLDLSYFR